MSNKWIFALSALAVFTGTSCNQCDDVICEGTGVILPFNIIEEGTGANLFDGETGIYDYSECKLYRITATDTIYYTVDYMKSPTNITDSLVALHVDARYFDYYFQFSDGDVDSLSFRYTTSTSSCCGTIYDPTNAIWNGRSTFPSTGDEPIFTIRK